MTLRLLGDTNDYCGKGLSGGRITVRPHPEAPLTAEENIVAGNVIAYGATAGEIFLRGKVGERFCVRNSGAHAVVEGVGDHGCEYMTGGRAVILGAIGRNFAAGMSGGVAYVLDLAENRVNHQMVELEVPSATDLDELRELVEKHYAATDSAVAHRLLTDWEAACAAVHQGDAGGLQAGPGSHRRRRARRAGRERRDHGGRSWLTPGDSSPPAASCPAAGPWTCACVTGTRSTRSSTRPRCASRPGAAWTAASRSATRAARSGT